MIQTEIINDTLIRHYSDVNKHLLQVETNIEYPEAVDVIPCRYTYQETDKEIEQQEPTEEEKTQALKIMGIQ